MNDEYTTGDQLVGCLWFFGGFALGISPMLYGFQTGIDWLLPVGFITTFVFPIVALLLPGPVRRLYQRRRARRLRLKSGGVGGEKSVGFRLSGTLPEGDLFDDDEDSTPGERAE